jgi:hypothetical protein
MRAKWLMALALAALFLGSANAGTAAAQGTQTGILRGTVQTPDKVAVAGATVTIKSAALQAERTTTTDADGIYIFRGLPPGTYTVSITKDTMAPITKSTDVPLGGTAELNLSMSLTRSETVSVSADISDVLTTPTVGANITKKTVDSLATPRTLTGIASLSPGVTMNTPNTNQLSINGAFAYDNVFLINGIDVNDNLFGSPQRLFIEDAIQETQVLTSGISAEYGRFGGGVVNAITKSGGDIFSGSFRTNMTNPTWSTLTPFDVDSGVVHTSKRNNNYEATFGGPIIPRRLWFFAATRLANIETQQTFDKTGINYVNANDNKRAEIKLTATPVTNQTFQFNYISNNTTLTRPPFGFSIDPNTIYTGQEPNSIVGGTWRGLMRNRYFAEAGYSQRTFAFENEGGTSPDIINSPIIGLSQLVHYNAPYFDATDPENRDNRQVFGSISTSVQGAGRHDLKAGYEWFRSHRTGGNSQSSTNFVFDADYASDAAGLPLMDPNGFLIPVFTPDKTLIEHWIPVRGATMNVDTHSLYLQDHWAMGRHVSTDLGVRFEKVRSEATGGILGVDTNTIVPRLAVAFDPKGDGHVVFHATYGHYAGKYNETLIGGNNNVGNPDLLLGVYTGPAGQGRNFAPGFDPANYETVFGRFPTANVSLAPKMSSPITREFTASGGADVGRHGYVQLTYVWRTTNNFIEDTIDIANGTTNVVREGVDIGTFSNVVFANSNVPERQYQGIVLQGRYTLRPNWQVAGNWTLQLKNDGTIEGEGTNQPGLSSIFLDYPGVDGVASIYDPNRHAPNGHLLQYQRSKVRLWTIYTWDLNRWGTVNASGIVRFDSPLTYSLVATGEPLSEIQNALLTASGYPDAPSSQSIYFSTRGSEKFNSYALLDTSISYDIGIVRSARPFIKVDIFNLLNNKKLITYDTTISADWDGPVDALGLPTTFIKAPTFGTATSASDFPQPFQGQTGGRTFVVALGIRF